MNRLFVESLLYQYVVNYFFDETWLCFLQNENGRDDSCLQTASNKVVVKQVHVAGEFIPFKRLRSVSKKNFLDGAKNQ